MSLWYIPKHPISILVSDILSKPCLHVRTWRQANAWFTIISVPVPFSPTSSNVPEVMESNIATFTTSHNKRRNRTTSYVIIKHRKGASTTFTRKGNGWQHSRYEKITDLMHVLTNLTTAKILYNTINLERPPKELYFFCWGGGVILPIPWLSSNFH